MRKALAIALCASLCGCVSGNGITSQGINGAADGRFVYEPFSYISEPSEAMFGYIIDSRTGVTYIVYNDCNGKYATGGISPLYNSDGTLVIDDRYQNGEVDR